MSGSTKIAAGSVAAREACEHMGDRRYMDIVLTDIEGASPLPDSHLVREHLSFVSGTLEPQDVFLTPLYR